MKNKMISVFGSRVSIKAVKYLKRSIKNQWLGLGPNVHEFEERFKKWRRLENFLLVDSGSNALFMALVSLNLKRGSEIILPSFTWVSCAQSVLMAGLTPVFCDVNLNDYNLSFEHIIPKITNKTGAVMVVHYGGLPVDMDPIINLGYPVIEDAAHAVNSHYKGKACGSIGDIGIFSFDAVKNLAIGEGGGITFKNSDHFNRAKLLRYAGIGKSGFEASNNGKSRWWEYNISEPFIKMLPSDIHAAIGLEQLDNINRNQKSRERQWNNYILHLGNVCQIDIPESPIYDFNHSYFTFTIKCEDRDYLAKFLYDNAVYTTLRYHPLHMNNLYESTNIHLKNTEILNEVALSLPLHPNLSKRDQNKVIRLIKEFYLDRR